MPNFVTLIPILIMKPDYSKLPKSWGVLMTDPKTQNELFREKIQPIISHKYAKYNGRNIYYGINRSGNSDYTSEKAAFENILSIEEFIELTEGFVLPEKWYIVVKTVAQDEMATKWSNETFGRDNFPIHGTDDRERNIHYTSEEGYMYFGNKDKVEGFTLISFEQFQQHVLKQPTKQEPMPTTNMQEKVIVPQEFFDGLIKDGTAIQRELVKENVDFFDRSATKQFIKDFYTNQVQTSCKWKKRLEEAFPFVKEEEIDLSTGKFDGKELFQQPGGYNSNHYLISIRHYGEYGNKGFYLNNNYNWKLVKDADNLFVIVPTKK